MNRIIKLQIVILVTFAFISLVFPLSSAGQKTGPAPQDVVFRPHDFSNRYYSQNGVLYKAITWRRNGADGLSVFDTQRYTIYNDIRVTATVPAYDSYGQMYFWYPLGQVTSSGFTDDIIGFSAMQTAKLFPIYVFPDSKYTIYNPIVNTRQAPMVDVSLPTFAATNPLGLREILIVNYSAKAHGPDGVKMMQYMGEKNGIATDGMPIIKSMDDLNMLVQEDYITLQYGDSGDGMLLEHFAISPILADPTNGAIAKDAFLSMSSRDGNPLKAEMNFVVQFGCLQKTGNWCPKY